MWRDLRFVLMWLLILAVPAQGFAAASMLNCGPGHHRTPVAHSHAGHSHEHAAAAVIAQHGHDDALAGHSHAAEAGAEASGSDHHIAKGSTIHKAMKGSCSACSSCCTAAAIPSAVVTFEATRAHDFFDPLTPRAVVSFVADGPERPPRFILA